MEIDNDTGTAATAATATSSVTNNRFQLKRWNAVALWAWGKFPVCLRRDQKLIRLLFRYSS